MVKSFPFSFDVAITTTFWHASLSDLYFLLRSHKNNIVSNFKDKTNCLLASTTSEAEGKKHFTFNYGLTMCIFSKQDCCGNNLEKMIVIIMPPPFCCSAVGNPVSATQFNAAHSTIKSIAFTPNISVVIGSNLFSVQKIQNDIKKYCSRDNSETGGSPGKS